MQHLGSGHGPHGAITGLLNDDWDADLMVHATSSLLTRVFRNSHSRWMLNQTLAQSGTKAASIRTTISGMIERMTEIVSSTKSDDKIFRSFEDLSTAIIEFLSLADFYSSVRPLLRSGRIGVRHAALKALRYRIGQSKAGNKIAQEASLAMVEDLTVVLSVSTEPDIHQVAILCIDTIAEKYGRVEPQKFSRIPHVIEEGKIIDAANPELAATALICLTTLVDVLRDTFVGSAPAVLKSCFEALDTDL